MRIPARDVIGLPTMRFRQMMKALRAFSLRLFNADCKPQDEQIPDPQQFTVSTIRQSVAQQQTTQPYNNRRKRMFFQQQSTVNQSVPAACSLMRTLTRPSKIPHMRSMGRSSRSTAIHRPSYRVPHHSLSDRPTSPKPRAADASDHHSHSAGRSFPKAAATAIADESAPAADQAIRRFRSA